MSDDLMSQGHLQYWESRQRRCKDDGVCHHACAADRCFRQESCVPLTVSGLNDKWQTPEEAAAEASKIAPAYRKYAAWLENFRADLACPACDASEPNSHQYTTAIDGDGKVVQLVFTSKAYDKIMVAVWTAGVIAHQATRARAFKLHRLSLRSRR